MGWGWRYQRLLEVVFGQDNAWVSGYPVGFWGAFRIWFSRRRENYHAEDYFAGKAVVIVGPNFMRDENLVARIADADVLAVVNNGYLTPAFQALKSHAEKVVLFHSLGMHVSTRHLRKEGFRELFYPLNEQCIEHDVSRFHMRNGSWLPLYRIAKASYVELQATLQGYRPNLGYAAIWTIVRGGCRSLYISGIDFLRYAYSSDYQDGVRSLAEKIDQFERYGCHNPDADLDSFRQLIKDHPVVECDAILTDILSRPTARLFYRGKAGGAGALDGRTPESVPVS